MKNKYFSGQGVVSLESDGKKYDLGNCTDLVFYDDNTFDLVWESLSKENIKLLLGKHVGTQQVVDNGKETTYDKYEITSKTQRNYTLHFDGINTAENEPVKVSVGVVINIPALVLSFINDGLASFYTTGKWKSPVSLMLPSKKENPNYQVSNGAVYRKEAQQLPTTKIVKSGKFIKILKLEEESKYRLINSINIDTISSLSIDEEDPRTTRILLSSCEVLFVACDIETITNIITKPEIDSMTSLCTHSEYFSGKRLPDMRYTRGNVNNIEIAYKRS